MSLVELTEWFNGSPTYPLHHLFALNLDVYSVAFSDTSEYTEFTWTLVEYTLRIAEWPWYPFFIVLFAENHYAKFCELPIDHRYISLIHRFTIKLIDLLLLVCTSILWLSLTPQMFVEWSQKLIQSINEVSCIYLI